MKDKLVTIAESALGFSPVIVSENYKVFEDIEPLTESDRNLLGFNVEKVKVDNNGIDAFVEYTNNLERYIRDSGKTLEEAVEDICRENDLLSDQIVIVVDESCTDKLDMVSLKENYNVRRV